MKKLLLFLIFIPTLSLKAMARFTAVNQSNCTIKMNETTLESHASKFICCAPNTEIKLTEVTTDPRNETSNRTEIIKPDTTLLTIDIECDTWNSGWRFSTTQKASRPLIILNGGKLSLMLMLRRPEYGTWERDILCPEGKHTFITAPADTDVVEVCNPDASLDDQKLSVRLHKDTTGLSIGVGALQGGLWAHQLKFTEVTTEEDGEQN